MRWWSCFITWFDARIILLMKVCLLVKVCFSWGAAQSLVQRLDEKHSVSGWAVTAALHRHSHTEINKPTKDSKRRRKWSRQAGNQSVHRSSFALKTVTQAWRSSHTIVSPAITQVQVRMKTITSSILIQLLIWRWRKSVENCTSDKPEGAA